MQGEGILETIAELSVAFTGSRESSQSSAPSRRAVGRPRRLSLPRFLGASLEALLFSLLPFLLHHAGLSEIATWRRAARSLHSISPGRSVQARSLQVFVGKLAANLLGPEAAIAFVA